MATAKLKIVKHVDDKKAAAIAGLINLARTNPELLLSALVNTCDTVADGNHTEHALSYKSGKLQTERELAIVKFVLSHE